jgi:DNA-binding NarL/FixJ family response regulator
MRILLADDQSKVRFALRTLLERSYGLEVTGEAADIQGMRQQLEESRPDLLLLDFRLPGPKPEDWIAALRCRCPGLHIIALSGHSQDDQAALEAGADAFVCKCAPPDRLLRAIEALCLCSALPDPTHEPAPDARTACA